MLAQKRLVRVTLDITCYDDLNIEDMDWKDLLELEGDEDVHATVKDYSDLYWCDSIRTGCGKKVFHRLCAIWEFDYLWKKSFPQVLCQLWNCPLPIDLSGSHALCWGRGWETTPLAFFTMSIYTENGYANRKEYLNELREEYGSDMVNTLISVLPASEDFDGLVTALEDAMDDF